MKPLSFVYGALVAGLVAVGAFELGRRERFLTPRLFVHGNEPATAVRVTPVSSLSRTQASALASAEAALSASLAAGHWYSTREWKRLIEALEPSDLERFIRKVDAIDRRLVRDPLLAALLSRWGEYDAARALGWAASLTDQRRRQQATIAIARGWAQANPDTLIAWLRTQPEGSERVSLLTATIGSLARSRPVAALDLVERESNREVLSFHLGPIFRSWAAHDPRAAAERARKVIPDYLRPAALRAVVQSWSDQHPQEAFAYVRSLPPESKGIQREFVSDCSFGRDIIENEPSVDDEEFMSDGPGRLVGNALGLMARKDVDMALAAVRTLPAGRERERALYDISLSLLSSDPEMAIAFAAGLQPGPAHATLTQRIAARYANSNAAGAMAWAQTLPEGSTRTNVLRTIGTQLANTDPVSAIALIQSLPDGIARGASLATIAGTWAQRDPAAAINWANSVADPSERFQLLRALAGPWMKHDPSAAMAFVLTQPKGQQDLLLPTIGAQLGESDPGAIQDLLSRIPDRALRNQVLQRTVQTLAYRNPTEAAALLARSTEAISPYLMTEVAQQWAARDPAKAAHWVSSLPAALPRNEALGGIARTWSSVDPQSTADWISSLPAGTDRDAATSGYIHNLASSVPELAAPAVLTISDARLRHDAIERVARTWLATDRRAATAWLATVPLSPELRQRYFKK